jgi:predicted nucleotidyltransferase
MGEGGQRRRRVRARRRQGEAAEVAGLAELVQALARALRGLLRRRPLGSTGVLLLDAARDLEHAADALRRAARELGGSP